MTVGRTFGCVFGGASVNDLAVAEVVMSVGVPRSLLRAAFARCVPYLAGVGVFSAACNILLLASPLFMLQIYDRVLASRSVPTLVTLTIIVAVVFLFYGIFELVRIRLLSRSALAIDAALESGAFLATLGKPIDWRQRGEPGLTRDLETVRGFLSGSGPLFIFDMPWLPLFLGLVVLLHPWLGAMATGGALILISLSVWNEFTVRPATVKGGEARAKQQQLVTAGQRNVEAVVSMGLAAGLAERWRRVHAGMIDMQRRAGDNAANFSAAIRSFRLFLQSAILALGAYLAIEGEISAGAMIAASIIAARALSPVEQAVAQWRGFVDTREAWRRLDCGLPGEALPARTALPAPRCSLVVSELAVAAPGGGEPLAEGIGFSLSAGQALAVVGPSAAGKSTLARALAGIWVPASGKIRIDGADLGQWDAAARGRHIGYLPQDVELFPGTVAENIARFQTDASAADIIGAAKQAHAHEMILLLPDGYDTEVGEAGRTLSAGQRQRIGLARALFGTPFLVVLDEPNAHLDSDGERALVAAVQGLRDRGSIVIVMAHRPSAIAAADHVLVMAGGRQRAFGDKQEVLPRVLQVSPTGRSAA